MKDLDLGEGLGSQADQDEFRFAAKVLRRASPALVGRTAATVRGTLFTPSGDRIPAFVAMHRARTGFGYSHVGQLDIPYGWIEEFAGSMRRFYFKSEHGESFTQLQVVEDKTPEADHPNYTARIILMRDETATRRH